MAKKRVLWWCIYFQVTWILMHWIPVQEGITVVKLKNKLEYSETPQIVSMKINSDRTWIGFEIIVVISLFTG